MPALRSRERTRARARCGNHQARRSLTPRWFGGCSCGCGSTPQSRAPSAAQGRGKAADALWRRRWWSIGQDKPGSRRIRRRRRALCKPRYLPPSPCAGRTQTSGSLTAPPQLILALGTVGAVPMQADFKGDLSNSPLAAADKKGAVTIKISGNPRVVDGDTLAYEPKMGEKTRIRLCACACLHACTRVRVQACLHACMPGARMLWRTRTQTHTQSREARCVCAPACIHT